ncbi:MAG: ComEA family DNA-binding protein [Cyclonatronaceae bacterium]
MPAGAFVAEDSSYYASRIALFEARAQHVEEELGALQQQYYPGETSRPLSETQTPVAAPPGPEHGAEVEATTRTAPAADMQEAPEETEKININTATSAELEGLPGIGPAIAGRIIEHRNAHGPFQRIEDIKNVRGIAEGRFSNIKDLITVGEETPE